MGTELACKTNTEYADDGTTVVAENIDSCDNTCTITWDNIDFTEAGFDTMVCIYNSSVVLNRICIPSGDVVDALGEEFEAVLEEYGASGEMNQILADLSIGWTGIAYSVGVAVGVGLVYMGFLYVFAGVIVWIVIVAYLALLGYLGYLFYNQSVEIQEY